MNKLFKRKLEKERDEVAIRKQHLFFGVHQYILLGLFFLCTLFGQVTPVAATKVDDAYAMIWPLTISLDRPYDDQARILNADTRQLIIDLNHAYQAQPVQPQFFVLTYDFSGGDYLNIDQKDAIAAYQELLNTVGASDNYILVVVSKQSAKTDKVENPIQIIQSATESPANAAIPKAVTDEIVSQEQHRTDKVSTNGQVGNVLKIMAKKINAANNISFAKPSLNLMALVKTAPAPKSKAKPKVQVAKPKKQTAKKQKRGPNYLLTAVIIGILMAVPALLALIFYLLRKAGEDNEAKQQTVN